MAFNKTGQEYIDWAKVREPVEKRKQPSRNVRLREAQEAFDERQLQRELDEELGIV